VVVEGVAVVQYKLLEVMEVPEEALMDLLKVLVHRVKVMMVVLVMMEI
jgi:hypothetical protein